MSISFKNKKLITVESPDFFIVGDIVIPTKNIQYIKKFEESSPYNKKTYTYKVFFSTPLIREERKSIYNDNKTICSDFMYIYLNERQYSQLLTYLGNKIVTLIK